MSGYTYSRVRSDWIGLDRAWIEKRKDGKGNASIFWNDDEMMIPPSHRTLDINRPSTYILLSSCLLLVRSTPYPGCLLFSITL